jgi:hypothetical protein
MNLRVMWAALAVTAAISLAERAGEEVDEAVDTIKNGGEESTANKVDDALDEARDAVEDKEKKN